MRKLILTILQVAFISIGFYRPVFAGNSAGLVNKANSLYNRKKYDEAIKLYNEAQIKSPDSAEISYNIGIAQYKKGDYNSAVSSFEKATVSRNKILESKTNFNIGNAKYKLGKLKENTELKQTVNLLRQSLDYYKRAIELDPRDEDAKINHELVEKELKVLLDKLKQEQDKKKEQSEQGKEIKEDEGQSQDGQQEKKPGEEEEKQQATQAKEQKTEEQKEEESKAAREAKQQAEEQKEKQAEELKGQAGEEAREMSEREANMLLEGYRQEENSSGKLEDQKRGFSGNVLKDW
ncbi:MAG: tetratricopeptide repeat protein [Candidatus Omnitrophica bacterium]|nr:tetratricopeptide repeat protein [Candidatus Omnitrophota bacterium]MBU1923496.1 tetratricopeptide repeat protein [Candidatus Omnitrophota bacterium]